MTPGDSTASDPRELAECIRAGDVSAYDAFVERHWALLVRYIVSFLGSVDDARDIAQEAFMRLWEERARLQPAGSIRSYLYQIARNLAINERKRRELYRTLARREAEEEPPLPTPAGEVEAAELRAVVERAIDLLPPRRREAFVLAHLQDLPHREIAEIMGISPQTVANQVSAALADLRQTLAPYLVETNDGHLQRSG